MLEKICQVIGHRRSRKRAVRKPDAWHSVCIFCNVELVRISHGNWRVYDPTIDDSEAASTPKAF